MIALPPVPVEVPDLEIQGELGRLVVNGVDVVDYVEAELDRRTPERALMRPTDADGFREAFSVLDRLWAGTVERARRVAGARAYGTRIPSELVSCSSPSSSQASTRNRSVVERCRPQTSR